MGSKHDAQGPRLSDQPVASSNSTVQYGSDAVAQQLSRLGLEYLAMVPGSSYRGLHDSLVNFNGNTAPEMLVCLHEEHTVAIAHGYAKIKEKPMAVSLHANVGLMNAVMAIYNAFCDRVPMLILGATGPLDSSERRPWIDHIHTATDQAALIRNFIKWDDQPYSANAAVASVIHATALTAAKPSAPVYVCLDSTLQESEIDPASIHFPDTQRYLQSKPAGASAVEVEQVVAALKESRRPLFLFGRMNRPQSSWNERIRLAERYDARVLTDLKQAACFPTNHPLHACPPGVFVSPQTSEAIRSADVIVAFDWVDLAGTLKASYGAGTEPSATIIQISQDSALHNGWSKDHFLLAPADVNISADPDRTLGAILEAGEDGKSGSEWPKPDAAAVNGKPTASASRDIFMPDLAEALYAALPPDEICLVRIPLGWAGRDLQASHPLGFCGQDGGAGLSSGPGQVVGAALALKDDRPDLMAVGVLGDGDYLMGCSALWTAARYRLPCLVIVANNSSFFNDEVHQERVAKRRDRPVENKWIGMRLDDPAPDVHKIAQGLGCVTVVDGQVTQKEQLASIIQAAVKEVRNGKAVVVDVRVLPEGYSSALEKAK